MRHPLLLIALGLSAALGPVSAARADSVADDLFHMGRDYCSIALVRQIGDFDSTPFRDAMRETGTAEWQLCGCVGEEFRTTGDDEMAAALKEEIAEGGDYAMLASFLRAGMSACKPGDGPGLDLGLSEEDLNMDILPADDSIEAALADNDFAADEGDIHACRLAFADDMLLPGFDPKEELSRLRAAGQSVDEVCRCAASYITSLGEAFQKEVEEAWNPPTIYGSTLAGGINICIGRP